MVECRSCEGPQDLREAACLDSLVNIMRAENTIDEIILVRELDVAYDKRVVRILRDLARLANLARELTSGWTEHEQCQRCPNNPARLSGELVGRLLASTPLGAIQLKGSYGNSRCRECVGRSTGTIEIIRTELRKMERKVAREAFLVVSDD